MVDPVDIDAARERIREARIRVDHLPGYLMRGAAPRGTAALLLEVLADLGRALDELDEARQYIAEEGARMRSAVEGAAGDAADAQWQADGSPHHG